MSSSAIHCRTLYNFHIASFPFLFFTTDVCDNKIVHMAFLWIAQLFVLLLARGGQGATTLAPTTTAAPVTTAAPATTAAPVTTAAPPTAAATTAAATTASATTASPTTAAAMDPTTQPTATTLGPEVNNPTTQATATTPPPGDGGIPPAPPQNPFFNFLPFFGFEGLAPFFFSQFFNPQPGPATPAFGNLPPWALFNENLLNLYFANQFTNQFGGGLAGNVVANSFLDLPDGYLRANVFNSFFRQNQPVGAGGGTTGGGTTGGGQAPLSPQQQQPVFNNNPAIPPWMFAMET